MKILAIDIGYHNMGLILAECGKGPKVYVEFMKKVSLEDYKYIHSNDIVDLIPLFVEDHRFIFDAAVTILIERQPPGGFTNIEVLLNYMFKDKVKLVQGNDVVTSNYAEYYINDDKIIFKDDVTLNRNGNILKGDYLTVSIDTKKAEMRSSGAKRVQRIFLVAEILDLRKRLAEHFLVSRFFHRMRLML